MFKKIIDLYEVMTIVNMTQLLEKYYNFVNEEKEYEMQVNKEKGMVVSTECNQAISHIRTARVLL